MSSVGGGRVKCTYAHCDAYFTSEKDMRRHKKNTEIHDYCPKCDQDFEDVDAFNEHKAFRPDKHDKACRLCTQEFKSAAGLKAHIELYHPVDQKIECIGCGHQFPRPWLYVEHLEFNYCSAISSTEFQGHVIHKILIAKILKGGEVQRRFMEKTSQYDAAVDTEEAGGVTLLDADDHLAQQVDYPTIKPEKGGEAHPTQQKAAAPGQYPHLPASGKKSVDASSGLSSTLQDMSLTSSPPPRPTRAWGGNASKSLFPKAKATPVPSVCSVNEHDESVQAQHGINILTTHFWDPTSKDWNPERFYDTVIQKYYCPFDCEQSFMIPNDLDRHIMDDHRVKRMKCPTCLKYFEAVFRWVAHCESRGATCPINRADDFPEFLNRATGGFLSLEEKVRPDHERNPAVFITDPHTRRVEKYRPAAQKYLQYYASKPPGWEDKRADSVRVGGPPQQKPPGRW